jgi:uncharacterized membrane protein
VPDPIDAVPPPPQPAAQSGLSDNAAGAIAYITIIPAIVFLVMPPYNTSPYIRFHAWQNLFLCITAFAIGIVGIIPILGWFIVLIGMPVLLVAWLICLIKALKGERFKLPFLGDLAEKQAGA